MHKEGVQYIPAVETEFIIQRDSFMFNKVKELVVCGLALGSHGHSCIRCFSCPVN